MSARYLFVARCSDGSLFTAITNDPEAAIQELNAGKGSSYVKARLPVFLAYAEEYMNEEDAESRAEQFRRLSREQKERLFAEATYPLASEYATA